MTCGYWKAGVNNHDAVFHVTFRENPFGGQFTVAGGLATAIDFLRGFQFTDTELDYLGSQHGNDRKPLFDSGFLDYLRTLQLTCDIDATPEGTLVFPDEPLIRVVGPIAQCQLLETALLNIFNFHTLIATKAARVCLAAKGDPVIEFGLRRSQGVDGGMTAARAAYIGGCAGTSNLQAGQQFAIPVSGTQAHSWIMFFENELEAFKTYAEAMPNNCIFLVDNWLRCLNPDAGKPLTLILSPSQRGEVNDVVAHPMNALILVDLQNDFMPGGALAVPRGDEVIPLADELQSALRSRRRDEGLASARSRQLCRKSPRQKAG